jgi:hypothetical protein
MNWGFYLHPHHWAAIYLGVLILLLYKPPKQLAGIGSFIQTHFGDSIGIYLLHFGVGLVILGGFYQQLQQVEQVGQSLIMTAIGILKLTKDAAPPAPPVPPAEQPVQNSKQAPPSPAAPTVLPLSTPTKNP